MDGRTLNDVAWLQGTSPFQMSELGITRSESKPNQASPDPARPVLPSSQQAISLILAASTTSYHHVHCNMGTATFSTESKPSNEKE